MFLSAMDQPEPPRPWLPRKKQLLSDPLSVDVPGAFLQPPMSADNLFVNRNNPSAQAPSRLTRYPTNSKEFHLEFLEQPKQAIALEWTDDKKPRSHKKRKNTEWPLEPPPVLAFRISNGVSEATDHAVLTSCPNVFCIATLTNRDGIPVSSEIMRGRHSSSLFKLEKEKSPKLNTTSPTMGVFLFDQIHIRFPGEYCLLFTLFEMQMHDQGMHAVVHNVIRSDIFTILPQPKRLPKPDPTSEILLALAAQGAKLKIRKPNEDRVKRKQDWSINANNPEWPVHTQMVQQQMSMPVHSQMMLQQKQQPAMPQPNFLPGTMPLPMPLPMPMPMTTVPYQMSIQAPAQMSYPQQQQPNWAMQHELPQDMNFGMIQDPNQQYMFGGPSSQPHGYGNGYGNNNNY